MFFFFILKSGGNLFDELHCNFGKGHFEKYLCEIILNLGLQLERKFRLKVYQFKLWLPFCLVEQNDLGILVHSLMKNIWVNLIRNLAMSSGKDVI